MLFKFIQSAEPRDIANIISALIVLIVGLAFIAWDGYRCKLRHKALKKRNQALSDFYNQMPKSVQRKIKYN